VEVKDVMAERWKVAKALAQGDNMEWVSWCKRLVMVRIGSVCMHGRSVACEDMLGVYGSS